MDRIPFFEDERGMELSEYALTGALIAIAILAALAVISGAHVAAFGRMSDVLSM